MLDAPVPLLAERIAARGRECEQPDEGGVDEARPSPRPDQLETSAPALSSGRLTPSPPPPTPTQAYMVQLEEAHHAWFEVDTPTSKVRIDCSGPAHEVEARVRARVAEILRREPQAG